MLIAFRFVIFGAHTSILFNIKVKNLMLIKCSICWPLPRMVSMFLSRSSISFKHVPFRCPFWDLELTIPLKYRCPDYCCVGLTLVLLLCSGNVVTCMWRILTSFWTYLHAPKAGMMQIQKMQINVTSVIKHIFEAHIQCDQIGLLKKLYCCQVTMT